MGVPDLPVHLEGTFPWSDSALVAKRVGEHRTFLAGDGGHLMAPAGGFGMSVGIQDAHDLAGKLAAVLHGRAAPELLATYDAERAPISRWMVEQMRRNALAARGVDRATTTSSSAQSEARPVMGRPEFFREHGLVFGASYSAGALTPDGTPPVAVLNPVTDYLPTARPGSRAPHLWLGRDDPRISILDLFGRSLVLLTGQNGHGWCQVAERLAGAGTRRAPLQAVRIATDGEWHDPERTWAATYGVDEAGAVLVRSDGYVAWRAAHASGDLQSELDTALGIVLGWKWVEGAGGSNDGDSLCRPSAPCRVLT